MVEEAKRYVPVLVDGDRKGNAEVLKKYDVSSYPWIFVADPGTERITARIGDGDAEAVLAQLRKARGGPAPRRRK